MYHGESPGEATQSCVSRRLLSRANSYLSSEFSFPSACVRQASFPGVTVDETP